ncbi:MAG TPA: hypothetical protein VM346_05980 [Sphingomicrobium sp.]|nr:hypothetical protein [Sphingomicrobium sp.]
MKQLIIAAVLLTVAACATRQVDPLMLPPEHDAHPNTSAGQ